MFLYVTYRNLWKIKRVKEHIIVAYQNRPFLQILKKDKEIDITIECKRLCEKLKDRIFLIYILLKKFSANI